MFKSSLIVTCALIFQIHYGESLNCSMCISMRDRYCKSSPPNPRECAPTYNACAVVTIYDNDTKELLGMERNCGMDGVEGRDDMCVPAFSAHFRTRVIRCYALCFTDGCNSYTSLFHFLNLLRRKKNFGAYDYPLL